MSGDDVLVRGAASAEEVAVVLAALTARLPSAPGCPSGYERWRAGRLAALRRTSSP